MPDVIVSSPMFGFCLSVLCFELGVFVQQKARSPLANPLLISGVLIIVLLSLTGISFEQYNNGARFITMFLSPCTAVLAVNIYNNLATIKKYLLPILAGTAAAAAASMGSVYLMCRLFRLDEELLLSLLPKSVTTAIGMPVAEQLGGYPAIASGVIIITGVLGNIFAEGFLRLLGIREPVARGVAIGTSAHAIGTARAIEMGETEGAMSSLSIVVAGLMTVIGASVFAQWI